jgi:hypothetical protein
MGREVGTITKRNVEVCMGKKLYPLSFPQIGTDISN